MSARLGAVIEGSLLACLGGFMLWLTLSGHSWQLLHPRFAVVNAVAGGVCVLLGGAFALRRVGPGTGLSFSRIACLALFLCLAFFSLRGVRVLSGGAGIVPASSDAVSFSGPMPGQGPGGSFDAGQPPPGSLTLEGLMPEQTARMVIGGVEYVRMNAAEMRMMADARPESLPGEIVWQGMVERTPELDALGLVAVFRVASVCCLADAVAPGFAVAVDDPDRFSPGQWVRVAGRLEISPKPLPGDPQVPGVIATVLDRERVFRCRDIVPIERPGVPFVFEFRETEPFAY
jgi:hypothetical protein